MATPAHLVLEDGTVFPGRPVARRRRLGRRDLLHDGDGGLPGGGHRPELRGPGARLQLPARRQLRRRRRPHGIGARVDARASSCGAPGHAGPRGSSGEGVVALEDVDTRALVRHVRSEGAMRCALGEAEPDALLERALRGAAPRLRAHADRAGPGDIRRSLCSPGRRSRTRWERAPGSPSSTSAASARSCAGSPSAGLEVAVVPPLCGRRLDPLARPEGGARRATGRATRPSSATPSRPCAAFSARAPVFGVCLGHQLLGLALGLRTFKLPFGHRGANHPVRVRNTSRVLVTVQNHGFAVEAADGAEVEPRLAERRHRRGPRGRRLLLAPVPPRGGPRPARRPALLRPDRRRMPKRTDLRSILIVGSGPDPHRAGVRVRLLRLAGLPRAARRGLPGRARQLEPGDDHDRPLVGRRDVPRAPRRRGARRDRREGASRRAPADARGPDGAQPGGRARRGGRPRRASGSS